MRSAAGLRHVGTLAANENSPFGISTGGTIQTEGTTALNQDLDLIQAAGAKRIRVDINWAQVQGAGSSSHDWTNIDAVVNGAMARGITPHGGILYTPSWINANPLTFPTPSQFATFCTAAVNHYRPLGMRSYELWNEPNTTSFCSAPSPSAYAALVIAAYPAIKAADPTATVVTAGLSPSPTDGTNYEPRDFLTGIYTAGAQGYFDAVGAHPYCQPDYATGTDSWSAWYQMYGATPSMRSIMIANGDTAKQIWATEYGTTVGTFTNGFTQAQQATSVGIAYSTWQTYSFAGPLFWYQHRDGGTDVTNDQDGYGLVANDFTHKAAYAAYQTAA